MGRLVCTFLQKDNSKSWKSWIALHRIKFKHQSTYLKSQTFHKFSKLCWAIHDIFTFPIYKSLFLQQFIRNSEFEWNSFFKKLTTHQQFKSVKFMNTGNSFSEALGLASTNLQYENRLLMELPWKLQEQIMNRTCSARVVFMLIPLTICFHTVG